MHPVIGGRTVSGPCDGRDDGGVRVLLLQLGNSAMVIFLLSCCGIRKGPRISVAPMAGTPLRYQITWAICSMISSTVRSSRSCFDTSPSVRSTSPVSYVMVSSRVGPTPLVSQWGS